MKKFISNQSTKGSNNGKATRTETLKQSNAASSQIPHSSALDKKKQPSLIALSFFQCMSHNEEIIWSLVHNLLVCSFEFGVLQYLFRLNTISKAIFGILIWNMSFFLILGTSQHCQWRSLGFMVYLVVILFVICQILRIILLYIRSILFGSSVVNFLFKNCIYSCF